MDRGATETNDRPTPTRRRRLQGMAGGAAVVAIARGGWSPEPVVAKGDGDDDDSGHGGGDQEDAVRATGEIPAGSLEVRIISDDAGAFQPGDVTVDLGQSVTFANAHGDTHTATGSGFNTGDIVPGGTVTVAIEQPGRFPYACNYHPAMTGTVNVRDETGRVPVRAASGQEAPADASAVAIAAFACAPNTVAVAAGTTVTWTDNDSAPHTVTADDGSFDSGTLQPGESYSSTFDAAGSYAYHGNIRPSMKASVLVA